MEVNMKRFVLINLVVLTLFLLPVFLFAQQNLNLAESAAKYTSDKKFALVIGNGNYTGLSPLANPVNDASDIAAVLDTLALLWKRC